MKIELPGIPPSLNRFAGRWNSWEYRAEKDTWTHNVRLLCLACKDRPKEPYEFAEVTITYFFGDNRRHDADNYCGKFLLDGLTAAGVIADDDFKHLHLTVRGMVDHKNPRTEIEVKG